LGAMRVQPTGTKVVAAALKVVSRLPPTSLYILPSSKGPRSVPKYVDADLLDDFADRRGRQPAGIAENHQCGRHGMRTSDREAP